MRAYLPIRRDKRRQIAALKDRRRLQIGPCATFNFESYDTIWFLVHELLAIEGGGEAQVAEELAAYGPLVPGGSELVATVILEVNDAAQRESMLARLGGVEKTMTLSVGGESIVGEPERSETDTALRASWVQFVHFRFTPGQIGKFRDPGTEVSVAIEHPNYRHRSVIPDTMREALSADFA